MKTVEEEVQLGEVQMEAGAHGIVAFVVFGVRWVVPKWAVFVIHDPSLGVWCLLIHPVFGVLPDCLRLLACLSGEPVYMELWSVVLFVDSSSVWDIVGLLWSLALFVTTVRKDAKILLLF